MFSWFVKAIAPISTITLFSLVSLPETPPNQSSFNHLPDSTLSVSIGVINTDSRPTMTVEKQVVIPKGYAYINHELTLTRAFPMDGVEQSTNWITGPSQTWRIDARLQENEHTPTRITLTASASPGRKNMEIGVQATLSVGLRKIQKAN